MLREQKAYYDNVQITLFKTLLKNDSIRYVYHDIKTDTLQICEDGFIMYILPRSIWKIDAKPNRTYKPLFDYDGFIKSGCGIPLKFDCTRRYTIARGKDKDVCIYKDVNGETVTVDKAVMNKTFTYGTEVSLYNTFIVVHNGNVVYNVVCQCKVND